MSKRRDPLYRPKGNGVAMRRAREQKGLEDEIALLRLMLRGLVEDKPEEEQTGEGQDQNGREEGKKREPKPADEGLILSVINTLGRALLAQARVAGADPDAASVRLRAALKQLGVIVVVDGGQESEDGKELEGMEALVAGEGSVSSTADKTGSEGSGEHSNQDA